MSDDVERVARALHAAEDSWNDTAWEFVPEGTQAEFIRQARVAIRALTASRSSNDEIVEVLEALLPSPLCGESWNLPDDEHVAIDITFGKLKTARALLSKVKEQG